MLARGELRGGRGDDARRVPQAHRERRGARAPLPAGPRRRARHQRHDRDPARAQGALRKPPRRADHRLGGRRRGDALGALHRRPLPSRQGDRPDRRGRLAAEDRDRLGPDRDRRGDAARTAARDRARGAEEGERRRLEGAARGARVRARRAARELGRDEGALAEREGARSTRSTRRGAGSRMPSAVLERAEPRGRPRARREMQFGEIPELEKEVAEDEEKLGRASGRGRLDALRRGDRGGRRRRSSPNGPGSRSAA